MASAAPIPSQVSTTILLSMDKSLASFAKPSPVQGDQRLPTEHENQLAFTLALQGEDAHFEGQSPGMRMLYGDLGSVNGIKTELLTQENLSALKEKPYRVQVLASKPFTLRLDFQIKKGSSPINLSTLHKFTQALDPIEAPGKVTLHSRVVDGEFYVELNQDAAEADQAR